VGTQIGITRAMKVQKTYRASYQLQRVVLFGAAGSCSIIFALFFLMFLASRISYHPSARLDTIDEMTGYAEFFFFVFLSYFSASIFVWRLDEFLSSRTVSWLPIAFLGSFLLPFVILLRVWIGVVISEQRLPNLQYFGAIAMGMLIIGTVCFVLSSVGCALVSALTGADKDQQVFQVDFGEGKVSRSE
jgi:hypothetical protein